MIVAQPELMESRGLTETAYTAIAAYQDYGAELTSRERLDALEDIEREELTLGLRSLTTSISGYRAPRAAMVKAGVDFDALDVRFYTRHGALRRALKAGEVDVIASYRDPKFVEESGFSARSLEEVAGQRWYLRNRYVGTSVHCAIEEELKSRRAEGSGYFTDIDLLETCR